MEEIALKVQHLAEQWIGTPYRHQGSGKQIGCDCLGLVRGIWREVYGEEPEEPPAYAPDWAERGSHDALYDAACRYFSAPIKIDQMQGGDLLLFRWRAGHAAKHLGIYCGNSAFIHAYEQSGVVLSPLVPQWRSKIAAVFRFPLRSR